MGLRKLLLDPGAQHVTMDKSLDSGDVYVDVDPGDSTGVSSKFDRSHSDVSDGVILTSSNEDKGLGDVQLQVYVPNQLSNLIATHPRLRVLQPQSPVTAAPHRMSRSSQFSRLFKRSQPACPETKSAGKNPPTRPLDSEGGISQKTRSSNSQLASRITEASNASGSQEEVTFKSTCNSRLTRPEPLHSGRNHCVDLTTLMDLSFEQYVRRLNSADRLRTAIRLARRDSPRDDSESSSEEDLFQ